jgi:endonuclease/exonuclease/phosphatase family metal-dependent hydrolase
MKVLSWNIGRRTEAWRALADSDADIALLQEAVPPPRDLETRFDVDPADWRTEGAGRSRAWRTAVVRLSDRVQVDWIESAALGLARADQFAVSRHGTATAAAVTYLPTGEAVTVVSLYGLWERPCSRTGRPWIYADGSVHRLIPDLSGFVGHRRNHRIIAAGDLLYGYGEHRDEYWAGRYATVFERFAAIGVPFVGLQAPAGRQAEPWPAELPPQSRNVPTFHTNTQCPATATRQLDFVFASEALAERITTAARNEVDSWGPSDHCRVAIELSPATLCPEPASDPSAAMGGLAGASSG